MKKFRTVGIYTLGCKVNQYESEAIAETFASLGYTVLPPTEKCDCYVVNTCTVTAESDRKARQFIRRAVHENPDAFLLVTGCLGQTDPDQIAKIAGVDYICGNAEKLSVVAYAEKLFECGKKNRIPEIVRSSPESAGFEKMKISKFDRTRAYIKIEDGCESRCTYCTIPQARGTIRSKLPQDVISEVETLTVGGCREIVLTGIETASYGKDLDEGIDLADLLCKVDKVPNVGRIRLGSLDPSLMKQPFVDRIAPLSSLAPHFHLSMQSGSDTVLARMKRKYNSRMALEGMERLKKAISGVRFTTDMIVGFPGETEEEFEETLRFLEKAGFLTVHVFPYSKRKGTPACTMPDQVDEEEKHRRVRKVMELQSILRKQQLDEMNGKTVSVLFETDENGFSFGHTPDFLEVSVPSTSPLHTLILPVRILGNNGTCCFGELLNRKEP